MGKPHVLAVVRNITEQVQAQQLLEQRVEERTRELSTLLEISRNMASTIELKPLPGLVLDQLKIVADYTGSSFSIVEREDLVLVENRGPAPLNGTLHIESAPGQGTCIRAQLQDDFRLVIGHAGRETRELPAVTKEGEYQCSETRGRQSLNITCKQERQIQHWYSRHS